MANGYLYVIKDTQTSLTKIGITGNWRSRMKTLKVGSRTECRTVVEISDNREWEKRLHKKYDYWRLVGTEWFKLSLNLEEELIQKVNQIGRPINLNEETEKAFTLAYMQRKIFEEWKQKTFNTEPDNPFLFCNAEIRAEAELRYSKGFRVSTSDWGWCKVAPDGKWIDCEEHEPSI